jgi:hypothetical protein
MSKLPTDRNFGFGKQIAWAGHQALKDMYGQGHFGSVATHARRWTQFCDWARTEQGIRDARHIDQAVIEAYAGDVQARVAEETLTVSYAQNLLSTTNTTLEALRGDQKVRIASPAALVERRCLVRTEAPNGMDWQTVEALAIRLRRLKYRQAAAVILLARTFGVRLREAILGDLRLWRKQARERGAIDIREGTKGGRGKEVERWVPVGEKGVLTLDQAIRISAELGCDRNLLRHDESFNDMGNNGEIYRARRHLQECGIKGYHELRAAWACERYMQQTGCPAPVMQGDLIANPAVDAEARRIIARELGHDRINVVAEYIGARP